MNTLLLATTAVLLVGWGVFIFTLASRGGNTLYDPEVTAMCAPARYDALTAQPAAAPRHIIAELAPPAGWHDVEHVAIVPAPAAAQVDDFDGWDDDEDGDDLPRGVPESELIALLTGQPVEQPAVVEPASVPVPNWPTPAVIETAPVVVNRTAARFGALEIESTRPR